MTRYRIWQDDANGWRYRAIPSGYPVYASTWREAWERVQARLNIKQTRSTT